MDDEEQRAALYRLQCATRLLAIRARLAQLAGDPVKRAELEQSWAPIRDWMRERPTPICRRDRGVL